MLRLQTAKVADKEQGERETPGKFLDRPWEALCKLTDIDPENTERNELRQISQSASDNWPKLQKLAFGPNQSLKNCYN